MTARVRHVLWQALSIVLHPFGVLSGLWLLALWRHRPDAIWQQAWPMLLAIAVCAAYVLWRWRRGDWSTVDASDKRERASLYAVILPVILVLALWQGGWALPFRLPGSSARGWGDCWQPVCHCLRRQMNLQL